MDRQIGYVKVGDTAPDFCLPSVTGKDIHLSDYSGDKVALFFWASW
ncbi:MAG: peroxiredoxin Q/BCP [Chloroflexi bacterium]|jgi:peroxiredoxin|nr:MAG: peroxiredoxin Q/BCP [Chloroflexota bacterium]|tara:strand:+ start:696 stop:833 length:138 start_codon:yes stop_codon:yes gene_type:complete